MKFDLHRPCDECPFRSDCLPAWLGRERAQEISETLRGGNTFSCHKTGRDEARDNEQHCAGALLVLRRDQGGFSGAVSLACAVGWLEPDRLDESAPVFDSLDEFIEHHSRGKEDRKNC